MSVRDALLLRYPDLRSLILLRICTMSATQIVSIAVAWQTYVGTHSTIALGFIGLTQFFPVLLLALLTGTAADHLYRRKLIGLSSVVTGVLTLCLVWTGGLAGTILWPMLALLFLSSCTRSFGLPAHFSLLAHIVPRSEFGSAIALGSSATKIAQIGGPALGGLLLGFGPEVNYAAAAALLFLSTALALSLTEHDSAWRRLSGRFSLTELVSGIPLIFRHRVVLGGISMDLFATLLGGATALLPVYVHDILHTGPASLGLLRAAPAAGSILAALALARWPLGRRAGRLMTAGFALYGVFTILFGFSTHYIWSLITLLLLGIADMYASIVRQTITQLATPDGLRGRVSAISTVFINASNQLGQFESGMTAALFGTVPSVVLGGAGSILIALSWVYWFPDLLKVDLSKDAAARAASANSPPAS